MSKIKLRTDPSANYRAVFIDGRTIRTPLDPSKPITELAFPEFYDVSFGTRCSGGCDYCAKPGTLVHTTNGLKPIEDVKRGDLVFTLNETTKEREIRPVSQLHVRPFEGEMIVISLESGESVYLTPNHKVMTLRGWVEAGSLLVTDEILSFMT